MLCNYNGAVLMNAGRGAVVDEAILPSALDNGWLRAIALDVFETEPLPPHSPLWDDSRVMISPHTALTGCRRFRSVTAIAATAESALT